ncbi:UNVERIFIED_CONTAM: hypothetical protein FKN15_072681 [Acipenser sinensis]
MGSSWLREFDLRLEGKVVPATLVQEEEEEEDDEEEYSSSGEAVLPTFDVPYFRYIDEDGEEVEGEETEEEEWSSSRSLSSTEEDSADSSVVSDRYVVVSGTPEKILEHLLSDLQLDESQGPQSKETGSVHTFGITNLYHDTVTKRYRGKEETSDALFRKRKVLHLVSQWTALYRDVLRDDEHVKLFIKTLYRYVLDDLYEYPSLEKDLKEFQKLLRIHRRQLCLRDLKRDYNQDGGLLAGFKAVLQLRYRGFKKMPTHKTPEECARDHRDFVVEDGKGKKHMIADTVRLIRHCRTDQLGHDGPQKDHQDVNSFVHHLHVIDNQQTLFGLSLSLEPRL